MAHAREPATGPVDARDSAARVQLSPRGVRKPVRGGPERALSNPHRWRAVDGDRALPVSRPQTHDRDDHRLGREATATYTPGRPRAGARGQLGHLREAAADDRGFARGV